MHRPAGLSRFPVAAAAAASIALVAATVAVLASPHASAASPCRVDYVVNQWSGGFTATIRLTVTEPHNGWTLTWTYTGDQQVTNSWNTRLTQTGRAISARDATWNAALAAGGSAEFGLQGSWGTANPSPTDFAVDGVACTDAAPGPSPSGPSPRPSSPSPSSPGPSSPRPSSPSPSGSSSSPPAAGCGSAVLCDGFENQSGTVPGGAWSLAFPNCQGAGTATVDSAVARSGAKSVRVNGAAGFCNHVFVATTQGLSGIGPVWWVRFYVRHSTSLPAAHVTFVAMRDSADGNRDLRVGGQNGALQWNRESDDATLPEQSPNGVALSVPLPTDQWGCVEFMVDGARGFLSTWLNGASVAGLQVDGVPTRDIDGQWLGRANWRPALTDLRLGWESYGEGADTLWYDDVAAGASRIGC